MGWLADGDYQIDLYHTYDKVFNFLGFEVHREVLHQDPYATYHGSVRDDKLTIGNQTADVLNNEYFKLEFLYRGRLKATNDVIIFRKRGSANVPGFGPADR
jgi:hypothetical protein